MTERLALPRGVTEDQLLECAILWDSKIGRMDAARKWSYVANVMPITMALAQLKMYLRDYDLVSNESLGISFQ